MDIVTECRKLFEELEEWPAESHWFCPMRNDTDTLSYDEPDVEEEGVTVEEKGKLIDEGNRRLSIAYRLCVVYGLGEDEAQDWQDIHHKRSMQLLCSCNPCVRNYHMERKDFLKELSLQFEDHIVAELSNRLNDMDFKRIDEGLIRARNLLDRIPDLQRNTRSLAQDLIALTALFEALSCPPYHTSSEKLYFPFSDPFKLVQTKRVLKLSDMLPSMTRFLFDPDLIRLNFARTAWQIFDRPLTSKIFEWSVHDALTDAMRSASSPSATVAEIQLFWEGLLLILYKLDKALITYSLRAMEIQPDIYHLALQHLSQYDSEEILELIIRTLHVLLQKSPEDFWAAYGAISSTTIAELIFTSKAFERLLASPQNHELVDNVHIPYALAWISPFVKSLPAAQQYDACRSILHHLFERFQDTRVPEASKLACFQAGLTTLSTTLTTFMSNDFKINSSTSFIVVNNILGLVGKHKAIVVDCANLKPDTKDDKELSRLGMQVVQTALNLSSKSILAEYQALDSKRHIGHELGSHSASIWQAVLDGFRRDNLEMAENILSGLILLVGLDQLKPRIFKDDKGKPYEDPLKQSKIRFNNVFCQVVEIISHVFERLSDFTPDKLRRLCNTPTTANPLLSGLTPSDQATYEAAVEVIKTITGKSGREDAIARLLHGSLAPTLTSLAWAARRISRHGTFAAVPFLVKTSSDVLHSLCDAQDSLLRIRSSPSNEEKKAIIHWWTEQWDAMAVAFKNYELWATGRDYTYMTNVCNDIMSYSERLFDQYSVLASTLDELAPTDGSRTASSVISKSSRKALLEHPRKAMEYLVKWLRLRDQYLLSTLVSLVCKILRRLGEFNMEIETLALREVELTGRGHHTQYKVTPQQRAELLRAFEEHQGLKLVEKSISVHRIKQGTIDAWSKSANGAKHEPSTSGSKGTSSPSSLSDDTQSLSRSVDAVKSTLDQIKLRQALKPTKSGTGQNSAMAMQKLKESREKAKNEKIQRDAQAIAKAIALRTPQSLVPGEGSGLRGIGVQGKDHVPIPKESGVMVSSDEDSDDDGTEVRTLINKKVERSKRLSEQERNHKRSLLQQPQGPIRKKKINRSVADMRARLVPNMDSLHLTILKWDIFHEGNDPPNAVECQKVSDTFQTTVDYYNTFYPLLISEAWRSLSTAKEENGFKPFEMKVVNRMSVDLFFEVGTTMQIAENRDNNIMEGDIVLLSKGQDPMRDRKDALCLSRVYRVNRKKDVIEISYRINGQASGRADLASAFLPNLKIRGTKITSMTTIEREYAALKSLEFYDLCEEVLSAQPSPILAYPEAVLVPIQRLYKLNIGQAKAIWSAKENDAFTLVQGPPGSGKTKTIIAMVGALLTDKFNASGVALNQPRGVESKATNGSLLQKKLLICAPSNAAVDELVMRLKDGVITLRGESHKIKVIRLGRSDAIDANVKDVTLDELVRAKMDGDSKNGTVVLSDREKLHQEAARLKETVDALRPKLEEARVKGDMDLERRLQREFDGKKRDQVRIGTKIDESKASGNTASRENEIARRRLQQEIIDSAHVLCSTLSGSGHEMFKNLNVEFETVIIDEAAQCIELSALIPLKYGCSKCILVGDPKQLPPTVLSRSAARYGYEQSLFVRMQQNHPKDVHLLDTQYRMHPEISIFPSKQFYDGKLIDGSNMAAARKKPWHANPLLGPYRFFDVKGTQTTGSRGHSFINVEEVKVAMQLYERLRNQYGSYDYRNNIGIITPYKAQLKELRGAFQKRYGEKVFDEIEFNTTDAFQGRESEIIIFSCVRARASGGIGFLDDIRRMNVGLTRAKSSLWVLGDSRSLIQGEFWAKLVEDAKSRGKYTEGDVAKLFNLPASLDALMSEANGSSHGNSVNNSRRSSIASVQMTDAPNLEDQWRPSVGSVDTVSSESSTQKRLPIKPKVQTPGERAERLKHLKAVGEEDVIRRADRHTSEVARAEQDRTSSMTLAHIASLPKTWFDGEFSWTLRKPGIYTKDLANYPKGNGRNTCHFCGEEDHLRGECGWLEAIETAGQLCNRCKGPPAHHVDKCNAPRCHKCGELGHETASCTGEVMSDKKRDEIAQIDKTHKRKKAIASQRGGWNVAQKSDGKREREVSPSEKDIPFSKKLSTNLQPAVIATSSLRDTADVAPVDKGNENPSNSLSHAPRRFAMTGLVPPPRKKPPADPLMRPRPRARPPK